MTKLNNGLLAILLDTFDELFLEIIAGEIGLIDPSINIFKLIKLMIIIITFKNIF